MSLEQQIKEDMKTAMRAGQEGKQKLGIIRMLISDITNTKIELKQQDSELDDTKVKEVVKAFVKRMDQEIEGYVLAKRDPSIKEADKAILMAYLPTQLSEAEIEAVVDAAIAKTGAASKGDLGKVMGVLKEFREQADMKVVKAVVESKLG